MLIKNSIEDFINLLASDSPTPGGGSVASLANALSAALLNMFCQISLKTITDEDKDLFSKLSAEIKEILQKSKHLIDEDANAFDEVMKAFKLPKDTESEKEHKKKEIQNALYKACLVPLENMKLSISLIEIAKEINNKGNQNAISDYKSAIHIAKAAYKCAKENVLINLDSIKDMEKKQIIINELKNFDLNNMG